MCWGADLLVRWNLIACSVSPLSPWPVVAAQHGLRWHSCWHTLSPGPLDDRKARRRHRIRILDGCDTRGRRRDILDRPTDTGSPPSPDRRPVSRSRTPAVEQPRPHAPRTSPPAPPEPRHTPNQPAKRRQAERQRHGHRHRPTRLLPHVNDQLLAGRRYTTWTNVQGEGR